MKLIDCHAHLEGDLDEVIKRAEKAGVIAIVNNGTSPKTNRKTLELAKKYKLVKPALGLHPTELAKFKKDIEKEIKVIKSNRNKIVAVGEIGLDYYWKQDTKKEQTALFKKMLALAVEIKKPVIVHSRNAQKDVLDVLKDFDLKVILHSFEANDKLIDEAVKRGYYFSIPASASRNSCFQNLIKKAPVNQLLTETDSPYLSFEKGKRNEPSFVIESLKEIAKLKKMDLDDCSEQILKNFNRVF